MPDAFATPFDYSEINIPGVLAVPFRADTQSHRDAPWNVAISTTGAGHHVSARRPENLIEARPARSLIAYATEACVVSRGTNDELGTLDGICALLNTDREFNDQHDSVGRLAAIDVRLPRSSSAFVHVLHGVLKHCTAATAAAAADDAHESDDPDAGTAAYLHAVLFETCYDLNAFLYYTSEAAAHVPRTRECMALLQHLADAGVAWGTFDTPRSAYKSIDTAARILCGAFSDTPFGVVGHAVAKCARLRLPSYTDALEFAACNAAFTDAAIAWPWCVMHANGIRDERLLRNTQMIVPCMLHSRAASGGGGGGDDDDDDASALFAERRAHYAAMLPAEASPTTEMPRLRTVHLVIGSELALFVYVHDDAQLIGIDQSTDTSDTTLSVVRAHMPALHVDQCVGVIANDLSSAPVALLVLRAVIEAQSRLRTHLSLALINATAFLDAVAPNALLFHIDARADNAPRDARVMQLDVTIDRCTVYVHQPTEMLARIAQSKFGKSVADFDVATARIYGRVAPHRFALNYGILDATATIENELARDNEPTIVRQLCSSSTHNIALVHTVHAVRGRHMSTLWSNVGVQLAKQGVRVEPSPFNYGNHGVVTLLTPSRGNTIRSATAAFANAIGTKAITGSYGDGDGGGDVDDDARRYAAAGDSRNVQRGSGGSSGGGGGGGDGGLAADDVYLVDRHRNARICGTTNASGSTRRSYYDANYTDAGADADVDADADSDEVDELDAEIPDDHDDEPGVLRVPEARIELLFPRASIVFVPTTEHSSDDENIYTLARVLHEAFTDVAYNAGPAHSSLPSMRDNIRALGGDGAPPPMSAQFFTLMAQWVGLDAIVWANNVDTARNLARAKNTATLERHAADTDQNAGVGASANREPRDVLLLVVEQDAAATDDNLDTLRDEFRRRYGSVHTIVIGVHLGPYGLPGGDVGGGDGDMATAAAASSSNLRVTFNGGPEELATAMRDLVFTARNMIAEPSMRAYAAQIGIVIGDPPATLKPDETGQTSYMHLSTAGARHTDGNDATAAATAATTNLRRFDSGIILKLTESMLLAKRMSAATL